MKRIVTFTFEFDIDEYAETYTTQPADQIDLDGAVAYLAEGIGEMGGVGNMAWSILPWRLEDSMDNAIWVGIPADEMWVVVIEGEFDTPATPAHITGPYTTEEDAEQAAREFRSTLGPEPTIYWALRGGSC